MEVIFGPIRDRLHSGDAKTCCDDCIRVLYPGIPFSSLDGEEGCSITAMRAAFSNFPCPKCLVHHNELHKIDGTFEPRTTAQMQQVYIDAMNAPNKTEADRVRQEFGLHNTEVFLIFFVL